MENKITRITTLDEHRKLLKTVFQTAKSSVLIVSPFIAESAIRHDRVPELVSGAVHRGVNVDIFTDDKLNRQTDGSWKPAAKAGMTSLVNAGAKVSVVDGIHNKTLARDEDLITEGSFNWLSAVRTKGAEMQRHERTLVYEGEAVKGMVEKEVTELKKVVQALTKPNYVIEKKSHIEPSKKTTPVRTALAFASDIGIVLSVATLAYHTPWPVALLFGIPAVALHFSLIRDKIKYETEKYQPTGTGCTDIGLFSGLPMSNTISDRSVFAHMRGLDDEDLKVLTEPPSNTLTNDVIGFY